MARWAVPQFSKKQVNNAGKMLIEGPFENIGGYFDALDVINNWRSIHGHPLNTFQTTLRIKGRQVDSHVLVAQRVKRLSSIEAKLRRFPTMTLSQMQDIGGCRAILSSAENVRDLVKSYQRSDLKHKLHTIDDYMNTPKPTGYRGVHLIYSYFSDKVDTYNSLKIEMQLRSSYMHAWATAVEIVGTFTRQALKSSQGEEDWLRFFALMSSAIAMMEGTEPVPGTPNSFDELNFELRDIEAKLDAIRRLRTYGTAPTILENPEVKGQHFFLLELDVAQSKLEVTGYKSGALDRAAADYLEAEKRFSSSQNGDAVLVSVESLASLRRAYPNYFLDTNMFVELVERAIAGNYLGVPV
ncbi:RelA/SpoT domain-containing protein [Rhizobium leguminosarum]|uniref:RelA/SpoT domain-containing protein n=1 Tax=Rhizobium leguminosarum TaxID=384 RepID=UPI0014411869|nr:RelA/SpoT domain-containing protein [Rhizobium leguminosarum]NKK82651.1 (p)ppGpp synthetase [Rhizobium leguminosarum bv. viciae]